MFDATIQIVGADVVKADDHIAPVFTTAIGIPVGPGQVLPVPWGNLRIPMRKEIALEFGRRVIEAAEELPDESEASKPDLIIANNMRDVDRVAHTDQHLRGQ